MTDALSVDDAVLYLQSCHRKKLLGRLFGVEEAAPGARRASDVAGGPGSHLDKEECLSVS